MFGKTARHIRSFPPEAEFAVVQGVVYRRAAALYSLIESAKLNGLNPQHYLADVLARIADHPARRIAELLPWNWQPLQATRAAA
jgi:hypothetical protein